MAIYLGSINHPTYVFGGLNEGAPFPYIVHQGDGNKIFQPGTQGGIITNAYPRSNIGSNIHWFEPYGSYTGKYFTNATVLLDKSKSIYPSNFGLGFSQFVLIPTETYALDTGYSFFGEKPLDISIVTKTTLGSATTINGVTYRATGWLLNQSLTPATKCLDKMEMWVFLRNLDGQSLSGIGRVVVPVIKKDGSYFLLDAPMYRQFDNPANRQCKLYIATSSNSENAYAFVGAPIVVLSATMSSGTKIEMQYMLCLKNDT